MNRAQHHRATRSSSPPTGSPPPSPPGSPPASPLRDFFFKDAAGFGALLAGVGTIILGLAAMVALYKTDDVIGQVLKIQEQAQTIQQGVDELSKAVKLLGEQLKQEKAEETIKRLDFFNLPKPSKEDFEKLLKPLAEPEQAPTVKPMGLNQTSPPKVFMPAQRVEEIADKLHAASTNEERVRILTGSLKIKYDGIDSVGDIDSQKNFDAIHKNVPQ